MTRFKIPCFAEIGYHDSTGKLNLLVSVWITPEDDENILIHARIATRKTWIPAWIKKFILQYIFKIILKQDKDILENISKNRAMFSQIEKSSEPLQSKNYLLGSYIKKLLENESVTIHNEILSINL